MIECSLRQMEEYGSLLPNWSEGKKSGIYLGSNYVYPMYGIQCWAVGVYVDVEYDKYKEQGLSDEEIVRQCVEFLNTPPPRKKYQKKKPVPTFGTLDEMPHLFRFKRDEDGTYIEMTLMTNQRKNKNFWGIGLIGGGAGIVARKRGRPKKVSTL